MDAPIGEVFAWYGRPGAIRRLTPPWQPVRVRSEARSLRDGRAVLVLPGGLRWVAAHQASGYRPPHRFVDELVSRPLASALTWRHTHAFAPEGEDATRVIDAVETNAPARLLRAMFTYRYAQLADDLAAHARARAWGDAPLTVAVTGASGLVGGAVTALLSTGGHRVVRLVRRAPRTPDERRWVPDAPARNLLAGVDAVVHLAGASIAGRFTEAHKARVRDSRIGPTRRLAEVAAAAPDGPRVFVAASAIGYYGPDRGEEVLTEASPRGEGVLADLVADWEGAAAPAREAGLRTVHVRTGIVQTPRGGTLRLLYPLFAAGLGGEIGGGRPWLSWIGIDDLADVYLRAVLDADLAGPVNAVAPEPQRNSDYTRVLARVLHRPALLPVPDLGPRVLLGREGTRELALANQHVVPARLREAGHHFRHPRLEPALRHVLGRAGTGGTVPDEAGM
ncbi:TIGR01777 family oxidoreductase [Streptomonospora sp. S1-112]|uniref:TIGR01777 family oxidoreductase n=1 Tax=Streptomonospora mangrovi TaxID=2883123 RepID=A0A9X3NK54_9ACTN|nr:TIGR01777 family oxidoreductase [Streptomonospora mangrovi]MDA0563613.1 TIGR01777 family oxidoreductase [Streptomonospora mangrovi]